MSDTTRKEERRKRILEECKLRGWVEADYHYYNSINCFIRFVSWLSIVLVGLSPIILYLLKYFFDEDVESIDQVAAVAIPAMKIGAILLLFRRALSHLLQRSFLCCLYLLQVVI